MEMERDAGVINVAYEMSGSGEPVVFIHGALIADTFRLLLAEPGLDTNYKLITYHRRGYGGSRHLEGPFSVAQHAADCDALLAHLGVAQAHIVGHSYGGSVALQLALDRPSLVRSLSLLEPALFLGSTAEGYRDALAQGQQQYRDHGAVTSIDEFLLSRFGQDYRRWLDQALPEAFDQAVADAPTWFEQEMPALRDWSFGEMELRRIAVPVLAVLGSDSDALWHRFGATHKLLLQLLPDVEGFVLPGATHGLQIQNPHDMAEALAAFWARYPLAAGVT